jgi:hypothetical protein
MELVREREDPPHESEVLKKECDGNGVQTYVTPPPFPFAATS